MVKVASMSITIVAVLKTNTDNVLTLVFSPLVLNSAQIANSLKRYSRENLFITLATRDLPTRELRLKPNRFGEQVTSCRQAD